MSVSTNLVNSNPFLASVGLSHLYFLYYFFLSVFVLPVAAAGG
jgi:hypothetical protein